MDYNPFILEVMGSNMEFSLVVFTPGNLIRYVTKEQDVAFSITRSKKKLVRNGDDPSLGNVLQEINGRRKLSQAEAFYRVDNSLCLTETNMKAVSVDADLPHERLLVGLEGGLEGNAVPAGTPAQMLSTFWILVRVGDSGVS